MILLAASALAACNHGPSTYELAVLQHRFEKDAGFAEPEGSVLLENDRLAFKGLSYFDVDTSYRYVVPIRVSDSLEVVEIEQQIGGSRPYVRMGWVDLQIRGATHTLSVFVPAAGAERAWIPFTDMTSGTETYGGGRYLDVDVEAGRAVVDFNYAYHPFCVYNPSFICGLPPDENRLAVAVRAGEKMPSFGKR